MNPELIKRLVQLTALSGANSAVMIEQLPADHRPATLAAVIMNLIGNIDDEIWEGIKRDAGRPCAEPECDCHTCQIPLIQELEKYRVKWKDITKRNRDRREQKESEGGFAV